VALELGGNGLGAAAPTIGAGAEQGSGCIHCSEGLGDVVEVDTGLVTLPPSVVVVNAPTLLEAGPAAGERSAGVKVKVLLRRTAGGGRCNLVVSGRA